MQVPLLQNEQLVPRMSRHLLLIGSLAVFFVQFVALGVPAPFLPTSPIGHVIGTQAVGLIFSAFPLGTVLAGPLVPRVLETFGARSVVSFGLVCSAASALSFAAVPSILADADTTLVFASLAMCRLVGGAAAAASETATFTALSMSDWGTQMGTVLAAVEVNIGLAISVGAALGGWLYRAGEAVPLVGAFSLPFIVTATAQLLLISLVAISIPGRALTSAPPAATDKARVWTVGRAATICSVIGWTACNEGLLPVLGPHLAAVAQLDTSQVGLTFALNMVLYMLASLPMGMLVDRASMVAHRKPVMAAGWALLSLGYSVIGPLATRLPPEHVMPLTLAAQAVLGVASSACVVPTIPDLRMGLTEDAIPVISASWTTSFSLGALLGPIVTSLLCASHGFSFTCLMLALFCALASCALLATYSMSTVPIKTPPLPHVMRVRSR